MNGNDDVVIGCSAGSSRAGGRAAASRGCTTRPTGPRCCGFRGTVLFGTTHRRRQFATSGTARPPRSRSKISIGARSPSGARSSMRTDSTLRMDHTFRHPRGTRRLVDAELLAGWMNCDAVLRHHLVPLQLARLATSSVDSCGGRQAH